MFDSKKRRKLEWPICLLCIVLISREFGCASEPPHLIDFIASLNGQRRAHLYDMLQPGLSEAVRVVNETNPNLLVGSWCSNSQSLDTESNTIASHGENGWCAGSAVVSATAAFLSSISNSIQSFESFCQSRLKGNYYQAVILTIPLKGTLKAVEWIANQYASLVDLSLSDQFGTQSIPCFICVTLDNKVRLELLSRYNIECFDGSVPLFVNHMMHDVILFRQALLASLFRMNIEQVIITDPQLIWLRHPTLLTSIQLRKNFSGTHFRPITVIEPMKHTGFLTPLISFDLRNNENVVNELFDGFRQAYRNGSHHHRKQYYKETDQWLLVAKSLGVDKDAVLPPSIFGDCNHGKGDLEDILFMYCGTDPLNISYNQSKSNFLKISSSSKYWHLRDVDKDMLYEENSELVPWKDLPLSVLQQRLLENAGLGMLTSEVSPLEVSMINHRRVKVILMQKDEESLLADWLWYHGSIFGLHNLHVIDHGSRVPEVVSVLRRMKEVGLDVRTYAGDFNMKKNVITDLARELALEADFVVALDCDEFIALDTSAELPPNDSSTNNDVIDTNPERIRSVFNHLQIDGRAYKLKCRNAVCPDVFIGDDNRIGIAHENNHPLRRGLWTSFGTIQSDVMQKTFYPGMTSFLFTDAGNHYGGVLADLGAAMVDKHTHPDLYFIESQLSILHFQAPKYKDWRQMVLQRAVADGFDQWEANQLLNYNGYNAHHANLYWLLKHGEEADVESKYVEYCTSSPLKADIESEQLARLLVNRPVLLGEDRQGI